MNHRIVCTDQVPCQRSGHIVSVGVGDDPGAASQQLTVAEVYAAMANGDGFYTSDGRASAWVRPYDCPCGRGTLRSDSDATTANNLDSLRLCRWRAA